MVSDDYSADFFEAIIDVKLWFLGDEHGVFSMVEPKRQRLEQPKLGQQLERPKPEQQLEQLKPIQRVERPISLVPV